MRLLPVAVASRLMPSGVASKAHASSNAAGNPSIASRMNTRSAQAGASNAGKAMLTTCTASHATTR